MTKEVAKVEQDATELVVGALVQGLSVQRVRELLAKSHPDADPEAVLVEAVEHFERASRCDKAVVQGWALEAYREIYRLAIATVDLPSAIRAVKELEKLATDVQCYGEEEDDEAADEPQALAPDEGKRAKPRRAAKKRKSKGKPRSNNSRGKGPSPPGEV